jgi:hypothetical protein
MMKQPCKRENKYVDKYSRNRPHWNQPLSGYIAYGTQDCHADRHGRGRGSSNDACTSMAVCIQGYEKQNDPERSTRRRRGGGKGSNERPIGDNRSFRLDKNTSLYVRIQVHSQRDVEGAQKLQHIDEIEQSDSQLLMAAHAAKATILEYQVGQVQTGEQ